jgi:HNH endonuclease
MKNWTESQEQFVRDNYLTMTHKEMAEITGKSWIQVKSMCRNNGLILKGEDLRNRKISAQQKAHAHKMLNEIQGQFVRDNYLTMPIKTIAKVLELKSQTAIRTYMKRNNMKVPKEIAEGFKSEGMFRLGVSPVNKGKKQTEFMSQEGIEKTKASRFQKGSKPHNTVEIGTEIVDKDGYLKIKIANPNRWMYVHRLIWMKEHGAIPRTHIVVFKDGDNRNFELSNLQLISRLENLKRNYNAEKMRACSKELQDNYVAGVLKRGTQLSTADIPLEIIELKRTQLKINRELKKLNQNESK